MSVSLNGVKINKPKSKTKFILMAVLVIEAIFTFFLYLSFAARVFELPQAKSAAGIPKLMSYQGVLTDSSGNKLGGTGTTYCFRYSIYDAASSGNKIWPSGTPSNSTTNVVDGIFSDQVGRVDTLDFNFFSTSTAYLNVEVNTVTGTCSGSWESLSPREQITASGFSISSANIYGDALRTPTATKVQVGSGAGVASGQVLLSLDVKNVSDTIGNSCSDNGAIWYNSGNTRALICEGSTIKVLSNPESIISGVTTNSGTAATSGTINFSNSNNVSFGIQGNVITATASFAGGGGAQTYYSTILGKKLAWQSTVTQLGQNSIYLFPEIINANIAASVVKMPVSILASSNTSASRQVGYTADFGVYVRHATNSTVLTQLYSTNYTLAVSYNSNTSMALSMITGIGNSTSYNTVACTSTNGIALSSLIYGNRELIMPWNTTLTPGEYWFALRNSSSSAGGAITSALTISYVGATTLTNAAIGVATSNVSGFNVGRNIGLGTYSVASAALPNAMSMTQIARAISSPVPVIYMLYNITR